MQKISKLKKKTKQLWTISKIWIDKIQHTIRAHTRVSKITLHIIARLIKIKLPKTLLIEDRRGKSWISMLIDSISLRRVKLRDISYITVYLSKHNDSRIFADSRRYILSHEKTEIKAIKFSRCAKPQRFQTIFADTRVTCRRALQTAANFAKLLRSDIQVADSRGNGALISSV